MKNYNFSTVNVTYMLEAQRLIKEDRSMAKILLRLPDDLFEFIEGLTPETINLIAQMKAPLPTISINSKMVRELMQQCNNPETAKINEFNDRLMLANG